MPPKHLQSKIKSNALKVGVIGLGYVGLPLGVSFAEKGLCVTGIDIDPEKLRALHAGRSYVLDVVSSKVRQLVRAKRLRFSSDYREVRALDAVIICVPTPLSKTKEPDISHIVDAARGIKPYLKKGQLVVLESTTYPGTTEEVIQPILEQSGLRAERDFFLAFSPERVDPGNKDFDTTSIPKIVGGVGPKSQEAVRALYATIIREVVVVSSPRAAEMVKLLENTFRSVNIGLINEIAIVSHRLGIDVWEVIEAAKTKPFGFMPFYPGPGLGGHCLPIDPLYLSWKSRKDHGFEARMIELASEINAEMPAYVVERVGHLLNEKGKPLKGSSILTLGVAYKKDVNDIRESPALEVMDELKKEGAKVTYSDPFVPVLGRVKSKKLTPVFLKKQDCVVILTNHSSFPYAMVAQYAPLVFDARHAMKAFKKDRKIHFL